MTGSIHPIDEQRVREIMREEIAAHAAEFSLQIDGTVIRACRDASIEISLDGLTLRCPPLPETLSLASQGTTYAAG